MRSRKAPATPDDMLPHYRGFGRAGRWDSADEDGWADPPASWPEMYEQVTDPREGLQLAVLIVGCAVVALGLLAWWIWIAVHG